MLGTVFPFVLLSSLACKPPPDAPDALEDLASYLYQHTENEDERYLQAGLTNLDAWLASNLAEAIEGYSIYNLADEAVDALDGSDRSVDDLLGAAVVFESAYSVDTLAQTILTVDNTEISPGAYQLYERSFDEDTSCFLSHGCDWIEGDTYSESSWAGLIDINTSNHLQYRWVETEELGTVLVQRNWLVEPAVGSCCDIVVYDMYYLRVLLPADSGTLALMATWFNVDYGILPITEAAAKNQIVKSMSTSAEDIEVWLGEN